MAYKRSNFPNSYLELPELHDLSPSLINKAEEYKALLIKPNKTVTEIERLNQLKSELQNYTISPEWINTLGDEISATQKYFVENTLDYVNQLKTDTQNYTESKKVEFQAEVDKFNLVGNYSPTVQYYKKNMVRFNGQIYLCIKDNYNNAPLDNSDNEFWILQSKKGDKGEQGVAGVGLTFKNEYSPSITYNPNEAVQYNGSVFYCISTVVGETPSENGTSWRLFLARSGIVVSSTPPSSPIDKMVWVDSNTNKFKYYNTGTSSWVALNADNADKLGGKTLSQIESDYNSKIGNKEDLQTADKSNLVNAINEIMNNSGIGGKKVDITGLDDNYTIRYDKLKDKWVVVLSEIDREPPGPITNFAAKAGNAQVTLNWINPTDSDFNKTKILRKVGSYPTSPVDGTVVYEGSGTTVNVTELTNDTMYYFRAFTYDNSGNVNTTTTSQQISATPKASVIYGVKIDTNNSNPETALTYTDDAVGFTPASGNNGNFSYGSWQDKFPFNQIKPCVLKNGVVNYYLNPNDYTQKESGGSADITSGNDGDVMVEFPKIYWKFETIGSNLYVRYSDTKIDSGYKCLAHTRGSAEKDKIYVSAYLGYEMASKLRSLRGKTPNTNKTIGAFRTLAKANGSDYEQMAYYPLLMLQVLYIVMFKNRDSQTALGHGYVDGNSSSIATGGTDKKGMFYGENTGKLQNKFCGIEDFWGNCYYWIDGLYSDSNRNIMIGNQNFNDNGSGYSNFGQGATSDISGYIDKVQGGTETGFIIKSSSGSSTTYYSDFGNLYAAARVADFGGYWDAASDAGAFRLQLSYFASGSASYIAARLAHL
ncbi:fibronectin type III domain-containing protein [Lysinibacillus sp. FSL K6-0057]|uniref:fibronectin type III domain-containing protein n=1 Tax=Lysinibacillus sp. FSL K6-0057 TaxID=2921411 RepID=UPI00315A8369